MSVDLTNPRLVVEEGSMGGGRGGGGWIEELAEGGERGCVI